MSEWVECQVEPRSPVAAALELDLRVSEVIRGMQDSDRAAADFLDSFYAPGAQAQQSDKPDPDSGGDDRGRYGRRVHRRFTDAWRLIDGAWQQFLRQSTVTRVERG